MSFGHPSQQSHKMAGFAKAAKSPKTPAHLRAHLTKLSQAVPLKNDSDAESIEPPTDELPMFYGRGATMSKNHPGFAAVQKKIQGEGYSKKSAGAILASASRKASPKAKKKNPRLNKVGDASSALYGG